MNRISYILLLSITTAISMAANVRAESQFLPEAKEKFNDFSDSNSTIYSPILECRENGYTISSCPEGSRLSKPCPYGISTGLYKECVPAASICLNKGYVLNCEEGYEADYTQRCPEDELYTKCKCNTCVGYYYSEEEANAEGYIADGEPCLSCNEKKYKRIENPCDGFEYDTTNCGVNSCGTLEGDTCQSGAILKYKDCAPCPTPACPEGTVNYDTYFCDGALRCYWPAEEPSCSQTTCFDYVYSASVTCKTGYVKKSCTDPCVGTRYKCEEQICTPTTDCSAYNLKTQTGCNSGYESCNDGCGNISYKCKTCTPIRDCSFYTHVTQTGCKTGYDSCNDGCEDVTKYKCKGYKKGDIFSAGNIVMSANTSFVTIFQIPTSSNQSAEEFCNASGKRPPTLQEVEEIYTMMNYDSVTKIYSAIRVEGGGCADYHGNFISEYMCEGGIYDVMNTCIYTMPQEQ